MTRVRAASQRAFSLLGYAVFSFAAALLAVELLAVLVFGLYHGLVLGKLRPPPFPPRGGHPFFSLTSLRYGDWASASPAYEGVSWAEDFWAEQKAAASRANAFRYEPFRVWGNTEVHSRYLNVDAHETGYWRRTANACAQGAPPKSKVWLFGGSTAFSGETPDFATLASALARRLNAGGARCVEVTNFGVPAYVMNQEVLLLIELLKKGQRPDHVVFYDGVNEAFVGAYSPGQPAAHGDLLPIKNKLERDVYLPDLAEKSYAFRVARALWRLVVPPAFVATNEKGEAVALKGDALGLKAKSVLDNYEADIRLVQALAKIHGFEAHFIWQPVMAYGAKKLVPFEQAWVEHPVFDLPGLREATRAVYEEAERRAARAKSFHFLGRIFDGVEAPIYVDQCHLGPKGDELVADAIAAAMRGSPGR
jgi:hypothetical protein